MHVLPLWPICWSCQSSWEWEAGHDEGCCTTAATAQLQVLPGSLVQSPFILIINYDLVNQIWIFLFWTSVTDRETLYWSTRHFTSFQISGNGCKGKFGWMSRTLSVPSSALYFYWMASLLLPLLYISLLPKSLIHLAALFQQQFDVLVLQLALGCWHESTSWRV